MREIKDLAPWIDDNVGVSSKAIFLFMARGDVPVPFDAPSDEGDRERCCVLLRAIPEWTPRLKEIEDLHLTGISYSQHGAKEVQPWNEQIPLIREQLKEKP